MDFMQTGSKFVDWIRRGQGKVQRRALVNAAKNFEVAGAFVD
jgi:hypothetical protein